MKLSKWRTLKKWYWLNDNNNNKSLLCDKINPFFLWKKMLCSRWKSVNVTSFFPMLLLLLLWFGHSSSLSFSAFYMNQNTILFFLSNFLIGRFFKYIDDLSNWRKILSFLCNLILWLASQSIDRQIKNYNKQQRWERKRCRTYK